jgi:hypothetical protein
MLALLHHHHHVVRDVVDNVVIVVADHLASYNFIGYLTLHVHQLDDMLDIDINIVVVIVDERWLVVVGGL